MTPNQSDVLNALYEVESTRHAQTGGFSFWISPDEVAAQLPNLHPLHGTALEVRSCLEQLWVQRRVLQVPLRMDEGEAGMRLTNAELDDDGSAPHGPGERILPLEDNDCRPCMQGVATVRVAIYPAAVSVAYRSRVAETTRMLSFNYQRFNMTPATGMVRYERHPQLRPRREVPIATFSERLSHQVDEGRIEFAHENGTTNAILRHGVDRTLLNQAVRAVLDAVDERLGGRTLLANFQCSSIAASLCGLYSDEYRANCDAHVVTAGVGSGKSYAFQIGALIHLAHQALVGTAGMRVLFVYPRVVLAANQVQELTALVEGVNARLHIRISPPLMDAGGQLPTMLTIPKGLGQKYTAIQQCYGGAFGLVVTNLDTLANRLAHPEAASNLARDIDLLVLDEVHLLRSLYGANARMLLRRLMLMRSVARLRRQHPAEPFARLVEMHEQHPEPPPYAIAASATVAEPRRHTATLLTLPIRCVMHMQANAAERVGSVHHVFLRQKPEVSNLTAAVNATSCLIHNRRDGLFREHYQRSDGAPISLSSLGLAGVDTRAATHIHKTIGFCDSLDQVGRWAAVVSDNEKTRADAMYQGQQDEGDRGQPLYFRRFQEPLWRVVHHDTFRQNPPIWVGQLRADYGELCARCKEGRPHEVDRVPPGLSQVGQAAVNTLWGLGDEGYLARLGVKEARHRNGQIFEPCREVGQSTRLRNLSDCPFFRCGLCWWWSMDHEGNNVPTHAQGLNGRRPARAGGPPRHPVSGVRVLPFTSQSDFQIAALQTIDDIFRADARDIFHRWTWQPGQPRVTSFVIGSPRVEVGVDLKRVMDGITFHAMRDPAGFQQKAGRVGRESGADVLLVHIVRESIRECFFFRSTAMLLDPSYLQPIPLHEDNRIVARQHIFMAILDFIALQGANPEGMRIADDGHRLLLVNDHAHTPSFQGRWRQKAEAVHEYLFGGHDHQSVNLEALLRYLMMLGAAENELRVLGRPDVGPGAAPLTVPSGAVDVFQHEIGPGFFLTALSQALTLAHASSVPNHFPALAPEGLLNDRPRHAEFMRQYNAGQGNAFQKRSYLHDLLKLPLFRRGIPGQNIPGDLPYAWASNLFEPSGNETVRVTMGQDEVGYETVSLAIRLLLPGTITYRYRSTALKVAVASRQGAQPPDRLMPNVFRVLLRVGDPNWFQPASCPPLTVQDLPEEFPGYGFGPVTVFTPTQIGLINAHDNPLVSIPQQLILDGDSINQGMQGGGTIELPTTPRSFALHWYRIESENPEPVPCRFKQRFTDYADGNLPDLPVHPLQSVFLEVRFDRSLQVTDFAWGLDRQYQTRAVDSPRFVYQDEAGNQFVVLGNHFQTSGLVFDVDLGEQSSVRRFIDQTWQHSASPTHQSVLLQALSRFLAKHAEVANPVTGTTTRPSIFTCRNLKSIILFHLLERWHPQPQSHAVPGGPLLLSLDLLRQVFTPGAQEFLDQTRFNAICGRIAELREPPDMTQHRDTLLSCWTHLDAGCQQVGHLDAAFFRSVALDTLVNSFALSMHEAALGVSGADEQDLGYFYRTEEDRVRVYLFDTDAFGNGTCDAVQRYFRISAAERALDERLRARGCPVDILPTRDFLSCLEMQMQECAASHATQLAYAQHDPHDHAYLEDLRALYLGERQSSGSVFGFLRDQVGLNAFDDILPLAVCPEFVSNLGSGIYPVYGTHQLVGSPQYPTYQALESALNICTHGCVSCLVSPETDLHGGLEAGARVNKLLLDAFYRECVCAVHPRYYPGEHPGRTTVWSQVPTRVSNCMGSAVPDAIPVTLNLPQGGQPATQSTPILVQPALVCQGWHRVFRRDWNRGLAAADLVRIVMGV